MSAHCEAGGAAFEVGGTAKRLHIPAVVRIRSERSKAFKKRLIEHIKNCLPMLRGEQGTVGCMFLQDQHTWSPVLGYIQKDKGQGHFELRTHNIPDADLVEVAAVCYFLLVFWCWPVVHCSHLFHWRLHAFAGSHVCRVPMHTMS